jgi:hypothetical protein
MGACTSVIPNSSPSIKKGRKRCNAPTASLLSREDSTGASVRIFPVLYFAESNPVCQKIAQKRMHVNNKFAVTRKNTIDKKADK